MKTPIRVGLLDLYNGKENLGIAAIRRHLAAADGVAGRPVVVETFDVRAKGDLPGLDHDLYVSSGGPGSPFDGVDARWEADYFRWLDALWNHNERAEGPSGATPKPALFICHSFQLLVRFFELADVTERRSESFGIFPVHKTDAGRREPLFDGLADPFYAADFRFWQAVNADTRRLDALDAAILAREKIRPDVDLERAIMAIRVSPHLVATQFHPEASPDGMFQHFRKRERRRQVVDKVGKRKYQQILHRLNDPDFLQPTHDTVIPTFLHRAMKTAAEVGVGRGA